MNAPDFVYKRELELSVIQTIADAMCVTDFDTSACSASLLRASGQTCLYSGNTGAIFNGVIVEVRVVVQQQRCARRANGSPCQLRKHQRASSR